MSDSKGTILADIEKYQDDRGGEHRAGTLTSGPLSTIQWYLQEYYRGRPLRIIETGCGASTILFSRSAERVHTFCYDDRASANSSVSFVTECPLFRQENVEWVFGPTQITAPRFITSEAIDIVLIDGPHGYPFPELEFYYFYRLLRPGSILIIDDIHIPTIKNLFDFLSQDDMFYLHQISGTTAFFVRTQAAMRDPEGDDWWLQRYNLQRFPAWNPRLHNARYKLPLRLSFEGNSTNLEHLSPRGVIFLDGRLMSEGALSWIRLPIECTASCEIRVELVVEFVAPEQRADAGFEFFLNGAYVSTHRSSDRGPIAVSANVVQPSDLQYVELKFHNFGLMYAEQIKGFPSAYFDRREPNVFINSISLRQLNQETTRSVNLHAGQIVEFTYEDQPIFFFVDQPDDSVQSSHAIGHFYEEEDLSVIKQYLGAGARIIDVGANVGNHLVYFSKVMGAREIIPVESCPRASKLLKLNAALNGVSGLDFSLLGVALGDNASPGLLGTLGLKNLREPNADDADGRVIIRRGDDLFRRRQCDFIRIDVKGHEFEILRSLSQTIDGWSPVVFVKATGMHKDNVLRFMRKLKYRVKEERVRDAGVTNLLLRRD